MSTEDAYLDEAALISRVDEVSDALEGLLAALTDEENLDLVLDRLVRTAQWAIPDADAVSLTVLQGDEARTAAATSAGVVDVDRSQYAAGAGPCLEAARQRKPIRTDVEEAHERWPDFVRAASTAGVKAFLSAPLIIAADDEHTDEVLGALNLYGFTAQAFNPVDESLLRLLTTTATAAIGSARRYLRCREMTEQLQRALISRAEIDQAKGALMAIHGIDGEAAFRKLVQQSQHQNTKLADVARNFMTSLRRP
ncbi:MAG: ANTAR domain-containing response regulator [Haloechinothrix sp.]